MHSCHLEVNDVNGVPDKVYTYITQPMGLTKTFFDKFPLCNLKGESHIFVYMNKIFSQHYFSNSPCNSLAELEDYIIHCISVFLAVLQTYQDTCHNLKPALHKPHSLTLF